MQVSLIVLVMPCRAASTMHPGVHAALCNCLDPVCAMCGEDDRENLSYVAPGLYLCAQCEEDREQATCGHADIAIEEVAQ